jgi:hypothetical protein
VLLNADLVHRCDWKFCGERFETADELADHQREHSAEVNDYNYDERDDQ